MLKKYYFNSEDIKNMKFLIKSSLLHQGLDIKSSHISEAFAYSIGYKTNSALNTYLNLTKECFFAINDTEYEKKFFERIFQLSGINVLDTSIYNIGLWIQKDLIFYKSNISKCDLKDFFIQLLNQINVDKEIIHPLSLFFNSIVDNIKGKISYQDLSPDNITKNDVYMEIYNNYKMYFIAYFIQNDIEKIKKQYGIQVYDRYCVLLNTFFQEANRKVKSFVIKEKNHLSIFLKMLEIIKNCSKTGRIDFLVQETESHFIENFLVSGNSFYHIHIPALQKDVFDEKLYDKKLWTEFVNSICHYINSHNGYINKISVDEIEYDLQGNFRIETKVPFSIIYNKFWTK